MLRVGPEKPNGSERNSRPLDVTKVLILTISCERMLKELRINPEARFEPSGCDKLNRERLALAAI
jgi:hypothetical protein